MEILKIIGVSIVLMAIIIFALGIKLWFNKKATFNPGCSGLRENGGNCGCGKENVCENSGLVHSEK